MYEFLRVCVCLSHDRQLTKTLLCNINPSNNNILYHSVHNSTVLEYKTYRFFLYRLNLLSKYNIYLEIKKYKNCLRSILKDQQILTRIKSYRRATYMYSEQEDPSFLSVSRLVKILKRKTAKRDKGILRYCFSSCGYRTHWQGTQ
jgi:hypothetical protein